MHNLDENGTLVISDLTEQEKLAIHEKTGSMLKSLFENWFTKYGAEIEQLVVFDEDEETIESIVAQVEKADEKCVWTQLNFDTGSFFTPVDGLVLGLNGTAIFSGVQEDGRYDTIEAYWISKTPLMAENSNDALYTYARCLCPFCENEEDENTTCSIPDCDGTWIFEID